MGRYIPKTSAVSLEQFCEDNAHLTKSQWQKEFNNLYPLRTAKLDMDEYITEKITPKARKEITVFSSVTAASVVLTGFFMVLISSLKNDSVWRETFITGGVISVVIMCLMIAMGLVTLLDNKYFPRYYYPHPQYEDVMVNSHPEMKKIYDKVYAATEGNLHHFLWIQYENFVDLTEEGRFLLSNQYSGKQSEKTFMDIVNTQKNSLMADIAEVKKYNMMTVEELDNINSDIIKAQYRHLLED